MKNLLILIVSLTTLLSCSKDSNEENGVESHKKYPRKVKIEYRMLGKPSGITTDIHFTNETGGETNLEGVSLPFSKTIVKQVDFADIISFSAFLDNSDDSEVTIEILVDGKIVDSKTFVNELIPIILYQFSK